MSTTPESSRVKYFRLSAEAVEILEVIEGRHGISQAKVVEMLLRAWKRRHAKLFPTKDQK